MIVVHQKFRTLYATTHFLMLILVTIIINSNIIIMLMKLAMQHGIWKFVLTITNKVYGCTHA